MNILREFWGGERVEERAEIVLHEPAVMNVEEEFFSYTDARAIPATATAGVETAASLFARAFGQAEVTPAGALAERISGELLGNVGRALIRNGDVVVDARTYQIAAGVEITGNTADDRRWTYRLDLVVPDGNRQVLRQGTDVWHFKYAQDPNGVQGLGPLDLAPTTALLAGWLEDRLASESATPAVHMLRTINPNVHSADYREAREKDLTMLLKLARDRHGAVGVMFQTPEDIGGVNKPDDIQRLGPEPPSALIDLRREVSASLLASMGIPSAVFDKSGAVSREALRAAVQTSIKPQSDRVAREIARKTGIDIELNLNRFASGDISSRARAVHSMTQAGVGLDEALELADLN